MTQENKDLLIKDLSARVPYGVKFVLNNGLNNVRTLISIGEDIPYEDWQMCAYACGISAIPIEHITPYLFPMSSMTKEQKEEMKSFNPFKTDEVKTLGDWAGRLIDFYHKHHIDYRGLIEKGLAIDATYKNIY